MKLDDLISIIDDSSVELPVKIYYEHPDKDHGDGLAKFVVREITDCFDPEGTDEEQITEAIRCLESAITDLEECIEALGNHLWLKDESDDYHV